MKPDGVGKVLLQEVGMRGVEEERPLPFDPQNIGHLDQSYFTETVPTAGGEVLPLMSHEHCHYSEPAGAATVRRKEQCDEGVPSDIDEPGLRGQLLGIMLDERERLLRLEFRPTLENG
jgi:hypothetical protein